MAEIKIHLIVISSMWTHVHHKIFLFLCSVLVCCNVKLMKVASVEQQREDNFHFFFQNFIPEFLESE